MSSHVVLEHAAHLLQAEPDAALDRAQRRIGALGDLDLGQALEIGELDRLALRIGQRRHRAAHRVASSDRATSGQTSGTVSAGSPASASGISSRRAAAAHDVDRAVVGDRQHPGAHRSHGRPHSGGIAPIADKRLLDSVLGQCRDPSLCASPIRTSHPDSGHIARTARVHRCLPPAARGAPRR